ncbi:hypothetical protein EC968_005982 [Mortierella alpina]|nr:hypothetical protein EC968_005982 [Mortierella alpina]
MIDSSSLSSCNVSLSDNLRRLIVSRPAVWTAFVEKVRNVYRLPADVAFDVQYKDDEGDVITLNTDSELEDVLSTHRLLNLVASVRFEIFLRDSDDTVDVGISREAPTRERSVAATSESAESLAHMHSIRLHHNPRGSYISDDEFLIDFEDAQEADAHKLSPSTFPSSVAGAVVDEGNNAMDTQQPDESKMNKQSTVSFPPKTVSPPRSPVVGPGLEFEALRMNEITDSIVASASEKHPQESAASAHSHSDSKASQDHAEEQIPAEASSSSPAGDRALIDQFQKLIQELQYVNNPMPPMPHMHPMHPAPPMPPSPSPAAPAAGSSSFCRGTTVPPSKPSPFEKGFPFNSSTPGCKGYSFKFKCGRPNPSDTEASSSEKKKFDVDKTNHQAEGSTSSAMPGSFPQHPQMTEIGNGWTWTALGDDQVQGDQPGPSSRPKFGWVWTGGEDGQSKNPEPSPLYTESDEKMTEAPQEGGCRFDDHPAGHRRRGGRGFGGFFGGGGGSGGFGGQSRCGRGGAHSFHLRPHHHSDVDHRADHAHHHGHRRRRRRRRRRHPGSRSGSEEGADSMADHQSSAEKLSFVKHLMSNAMPCHLAKRSAARTAPRSYGPSTNLEGGDRPDGDESHHAGTYCWTGHVEHRNQAIGDINQTALGRPHISKNLGQANSNPLATTPGAGTGETLSRQTQGQLSSVIFK